MRLESRPPESRTPTGHVGHHAPVDRGAQRVQQRVLPVVLVPALLLRQPAVGAPTSSAPRLRRPSGSTVSSVAGGSLRTPCRIVWGGGTTPCKRGSGAARPGRSTCRCPRPPAAPGSVEAKRSAPPTSARYSGLMPRRSRASSSRPLSRSTRAKENMPMKRSTQRSPQRRVRLGDHLGVARREEPVALALELGPQLAVVVDAAVERDGAPDVRIDERLRALLGQVDDLQPAVGEGDRPGRPGRPRRRARAAPSSRPSPRRSRRRRAHQAGALRRIRTSAAATRDRAVCRVPLEARWRRPGSDGDPSTAATLRASSRRAVALAASLRPSERKPTAKEARAQRLGPAADLAQRAINRAAVRHGPLRRPRGRAHGPHDRAGRGDRRRPCSSCTSRWATTWTTRSTSVARVEAAEHVARAGRRACSPSGRCRRTATSLRASAEQRAPRSWSIRARRPSASSRRSRARA